MAALKNSLELDRKSLSAVGRASVIGLHMISGVAVGCGLGWLLDFWLDARPWFFFLFFALGVAAGFRNVWLDTRRILNTQELAEQEARKGEKTDAERPKTPPAGDGDQG
jgi:ATP synthase protein I